MSKAHFQFVISVALAFLASKAKKPKLPTEIDENSQLGKFLIKYFQNLATHKPTKGLVISGLGDERLSPLMEKLGELINGDVPELFCNLNLGKDWPILRDLLWIINCLALNDVPALIAKLNGNPAKLLSTLTKELRRINEEFFPSDVPTELIVLLVAGSDFNLAGRKSLKSLAKKNTLASSQNPRTGVLADSFTDWIGATPTGMLTSGGSKSSHARPPQ